MAKINLFFNGKLCYLNLKKMVNQSQNNSFKAFDYVKITILGFAFSALWQSMHTIILPVRLLDFTPEAEKNTALGIITFSGLVVAMLAQPIFGSISDSSKFKMGRRKPFVLIGALLVLAFLPGIGIFGNFAAIFTIYCLLQLSANVAQGPYQGYIPDILPCNKRGLASGVKAFLEIAGGALAVLIVSRLMSGYEDSGNLKLLGFSLTLIGFLIIVSLAIIFLIKEKPAGKENRSTFSLKTLLSTFKLDLSKDRAFMWYLASRLLIFMAFATLQQFALYFLRDVIGVAEPAEAAANFTIVGVLGMMISVYPAGYFSDKIGRKPIAVASGLLGAFAILLILIFQTYTMVLISAGIIGVAVGSFTSTNWALATDLLSEGEEARYLGIANMATAGGAALARLIGPVIDFFNNISAGSGYQVMFISCLLYFAGGALLVLKIKRKC